jgi:hypothetical protein
MILHRKSVGLPARLKTPPDLKEADSILPPCVEFEIFRRHARLVTRSCKVAVGLQPIQGGPAGHGVRMNGNIRVSAAGFIASAAYGRFLLALLLSGLLAIRLSPRALVVAGGLAAAIGMALVAGSSSMPMLAAGVTLGRAPASVGSPTTQPPPGRFPNT